MENYTKNARGIIRAVVHDAFGDYVQNVQLSTADYREELDKIAGTILEEMAAPDLYEALKIVSTAILSKGGSEPYQKGGDIMNREDFYPTDEELAEWGVERAEAYNIELSIDNAVKKIVAELVKDTDNFRLPLSLGIIADLEKLTEDY